MTERTVLAGKNKMTSTSLLSDQRGVVALEMPAVVFFLMISLLLPLADLAIAGFKFTFAYQALRNMGQLTQNMGQLTRYYPPADVTSSASITGWQNSLPKTVDGYLVSAQIYCGDTETPAPCASGTILPKYYTFSTSFTLSPMVLGRFLCSTCTVKYSQRFQ